MPIIKAKHYYLDYVLFDSLGKKIEKKALSLSKQDPEISLIRGAVDDVLRDKRFENRCSRLDACELYHYRRQPYRSKYGVSILFQMRKVMPEKKIKKVVVA